MSTRRHKQKGYALGLMAVTAIGMIGFMGLAIDAGYLEYLQTRIQTAADGAAAAAALEKATGSGTAAAAAAGRHGSALNGFTDGSNGVTVTINQPPVIGAFAGNTAYVEAIVAQAVPTFFMRIYNTNTVNVSSRAVSAVGTTGGSTTPCVYTLAATGSKSFYMTGSSVMTSCGIQVDSSDNKALYVDGSIRLTATSIKVVGGFFSTGSNIVSPTPSTGQPSKPDPLDYKTAPTYSATCNFTNFSPNSGTTLSPGVYCGGITLHSSNNYTFNPGNYILLGGGFTVDSSANITGTGVTFYNTFDSSHAMGGIKFTGSGNITLTAPTSGAQEAMLFFQDRAGSTSVSNTIDGSNSMRLTGALYFPTQALNFSGSNSTPYTIIVAKSIKIDGSNTLSSDYSTLASGNPLIQTTTTSPFGE